MMNNMKKVAKILGVELDEMFCVSDIDKPYSADVLKITQEGLVYYDVCEGAWIKDEGIILDELLHGDRVLYRRVNED